MSNLKKLTDTMAGKTEVSETKEDLARVDFYIRKFPRPRYKNTPVRLTTTIVRNSPISSGTWLALQLSLKVGKFGSASRCVVAYYRTDKEGCLQEFLSDSTVVEWDRRKAKRKFNQFRNEYKISNRNHK
jgi:hypothetical protein